MSLGVNDGSADHPDDLRSHTTSSRLRLHGVGTPVHNDAVVGERTCDLDGGALPPESRAVLELLAAGLTLGDAATRLHLSRRTADRRLAQARQVLGVATTAQAVATLRAPARDVQLPEHPPRLVGRDDVLLEVAEDLAGDRAVLVVGEGGVGKTAFLRAVATADGRPVHSATAHAGTRWQDYGPIRQAVGAATAGGDIEAVAAQVEATLGPDVLVIDDLHLADPATVAVLAALSGRVAVIAAARPEAAVGDADVVDILRASGFRIVQLEALDRAATTELARTLAPALGAKRVDEVVEGSAGLPLIVEFLCGTAPELRADRGLVPAIDALSPAALDTAVLLAVSHRPLRIEQGAEELLASRIALRGGDGRLRIKHQLIADAVLAAAGAAVVRAMHRRLAASAEGPAEAAQHWMLAGDLDAAVDQGLLAAEAATSPTERARLLLLVAQCCHDDRSSARWLEAAAALSVAGLHDEAREALESLEDAHVSAEQEGRKLLIQARAAWHLGDAATAVECARSGLDAVGGSGGRTEAMLLIESVRCEVLSTGITDDHDGRLARATSIIDVGPGRGSLLNVAALLPYFRDGAGLAEWESGLAAARLEGDVDTAMRCANNIIMWNESSGDQASSLDLALEMSAEAESLGLGSWQLQFTTAAANLMYHRGRYDEALTLLDHVEHGAVDVRTRQQATVVRAAILIDLGMLDAARECMGPRPASPARDWLADDGMYYLHAAWELAAGRPQETLRLIEEFARMAQTESSMWIFLLPIRAWAEHDLSLPITPHDRTSPIPLICGLLAEASGVAHLAHDPSRATELLDAAAELGREWSLAQGLRAQWGAAEAARLAGADDATDRLLEVERAAAGMRMEPLLARIHRSLRQTGVTRKARRAPDRSGLLTERERIVIDLVSQGSSYAEVARRLRVGRPTVRRVLANAQIKLGASSRLAAVAAAGGS